MGPCRLGQISYMQRTKDDLRAKLRVCRLVTEFGPQCGCQTLSCFETRCPAVNGRSTQPDEKNNKSRPNNLASTANCTKPEPERYSPREAGTFGCGLGSRNLRIACPSRKPQTLYLNPSSLIESLKCQTMTPSKLEGEKAGIIKLPETTSPVLSQT